MTLYVSGLGLLLFSPTALAEDDDLAAERQRLVKINELMTEADKATTEDWRRRMLRESTLSELDILAGELEERDDPESDALHASVLTSSGAARCRHGDSSRGRADLYAARELTDNEERLKRIDRKLSECPGQPPSETRARLEVEQPVSDPVEWTDDDLMLDDWDEDYVWGQPTPTHSTASSPTYTRVDPKPGRPHQVGGVLLGVVGAAVVLGTWQTYEISSAMSHDQWTGLQVGNTLGWVGVAGGGVLVISGTARNVSIQAGPRLGAGVPR